VPDLGAELVELDGEDDHVQLLVASPPQVAVARLVNSLKGVSARRPRQPYQLRIHSIGQVSAPAQMPGRA